MAQIVTIKLTDDIDGNNADETIMFALDGKHYEIDLSNENVASLHMALKPFVDKARSARGAVRQTRQPRGSGEGSANKTLFSQLAAEEKERFRVWANMPTTRRISDTRIQEWVKTGKP